MVKRELYLKRIRPFFDSEMVKVITGIRRCGKSTIIKQIMQELGDREIPDDRIIYINLQTVKKISMLLKTILTKAKVFSTKILMTFLPEKDLCDFACAHKVDT